LQLSEGTFWLLVLGNTNVRKWFSASEVLGLIKWFSAPAVLDVIKLFSLPVVLDVIK
jgi:hypothetical protein